MHKKQLLAKLDKILKKHYKHLYNRIYYSEHISHVSGEYNTLTKNIRIRYTKYTDERDLIQTIFHELGHGFCVYHNKWPSYHTLAICNNKEKKNYINTALKAERWVDKWAKNEMERWFPTLKYKSLYLTQEGVNFLNKHIEHVKAFKYN